MSPIYRAKNKRKKIYGRQGILGERMRIFSSAEGAESDISEKEGFGYNKVNKENAFLEEELNKALFF